MDSRPCQVCGLVITRHPCARCGHVAGDVLGETAAIIEGAMLAEEAERFLAFGPIEESIDELRKEYDARGMGAEFPLDALKVLYNYAFSSGRAEPLDEDPE